MLIDTPEIALPLTASFIVPEIFPAEQLLLESKVTVATTTV